MALLRVWICSLLPRLLVLGLLAGCPPVQAVAQDPGTTVTKRGAIAEDLYLAGQRVEVLADVDGDVLAVGGSVIVHGHLLLIAGLIALALISRVPVAGPLVVIVALLVGLGAVTLRAFRTYTGPTAVTA